MFAFSGSLSPYTIAPIPCTLLFVITHPPQSPLLISIQDCALAWHSPEKILYAAIGEEEYAGRWQDWFEDHTMDRWLPSIQLYP